MPLGDYSKEVDKTGMKLGKQDIWGNFLSPIIFQFDICDCLS